MTLFKSRTRRKVEKLYAELIYQRYEIRKQLDTIKWGDTAYYKKLNEDNILRTQINVLAKLLWKWKTLIYI